jgi:hypothetical protein
VNVGGGLELLGVAEGHRAAEHLSEHEVLEDNLVGDGSRVDELGVAVVDVGLLSSEHAGETAQRLLRSSLSLLNRGSLSGSRSLSGGSSLGLSSRLGLSNNGLLGVNLSLVRHLNEERIEENAE